jgi:4-amino-4-deoxy-L-arabinose transferase-like glycosyltransferase
VEAPAKAYEARKLALFGTLATSEADEYRFWSVQSPAYVFPLGAFMSLAGVGYAELRIYGVLVGLLGHLLLLGMLYGRISPLSLLVVGAFTGIHFYYLHYLRAGLLEPSVNTWIIVCVACALAAKRDTRWLFGVPVAWTLAFLTKQSAIAFLPLLALALGIGVYEARRELSRNRLLSLAIVVGLCALGLFVLVRSDAYQRTLAWNYQHMFLGNESFSGEGSSVWGLLARAGSRLLDWQHWKQGVLLVIPVCLPFALVHTARNGARLFKRRPVSRLSLLTSVWFLLGLAALFTVEHARGRFSLILLPPAFIAFGLELDFWSKKLTLRYGRPLAIAAIVAAASFTHVRWSSDWLLHPRSELRDTNHELAALLGPKDAVLGVRAPLLAFDSSADVFFVKRHFNDSADSLALLGATHLLLSKQELATRVIKRRFPSALRGNPPLGSVKFEGKQYQLFELREPLQRGVARRQRDELLEQRGKQDAEADPR